MKILTLAAIAFASGLCFADTVYLKDGRKLEGAVTEDGEEYAIKGKFGTVRVKKADVDRVEAATAAKPPATGKPPGAEKPPDSDQGPRTGTKALSGPERGVLESAEKLFREDKAAEGLKSLEAMLNAVATYDWEGQRSLSLLASRLALRAGDRGRALKDLERWAALAPANSRVSDQTRARLLRDSADGNFLVKAEDLKIYALSGLEPGPHPLWDERVVAFALRLEARPDEAKGAKALEEARGFEKKNNNEALRCFRAAEQAYARANDISPGCCGPSHIAAVRGLLDTLFALGIEDDEKQMASSPLNVAFEMKANAEGRLRFTPAGRAKFDETRRDWNTQVERLEAHMKEINALKARFPEEVAKQQGNYDRLQTALTDMIPKIRTAFAKALQEHN